jgi:uncharacterized phage protein (TIGR01671 family)
MNWAKFRAWDKKTQKMYRVKELSFGEDGIDQVYLEGMIDSRNWDDVELMMWTGMEDKDGIPIYDGDIIRKSKGGKSVLGLVRWEPDLPGFDICQFTFTKGDDGLVFEEDGQNFGYSKHLTVIGNKFENPELLVFDKGTD